MKGEKIDLKSLSQSNFFWKKKKKTPQNIESVNAGLSVKDTCKLGYSCLPPSRCVSFKDENITSLSNRRAIRELRARNGCGQSHTGKKNKLLLLLMKQLVTLLKEIPPSCTFNKRNRLLVWGVDFIITVPTRIIHLTYVGYSATQGGFRNSGCSKWDLE